MSNIISSKEIILFIKSIPIGMANTLPGVSGGTIALVVGIYQKLLEAVKKFRFKTLILVGSGMALGIYVGASFISEFYTAKPLLTAYFLFGLVLTSARTTYKNIGSLKFLNLFFIVAGLITALYFSAGSSTLFLSSSRYILFFVGGFFGSIAMVLPGISGGTLLILIGLYQPLLNAVNSLDFLLIGIYLTGVVSGLISFAWAFSFLLNKFRANIMSLLTGLIIGSSAAVFPEQFVLEGVIYFIFAVALIILLEVSAKKFN
ncbi:putative membrane protein [Halanaerobium sp. DL-01]|uniref:DUF368 domain-containing protein n=1 Tax=Halanaerobium sp. DL-01 TaxID=1653064 RepID=UPI000DF4C82D|nr:DUF368 domain-containing protein [Halanaerobium sp. DL-01]RCW89132.1 putative membrane protein [Halanaerobium sp. DL-01]